MGRRISYSLFVVGELLVVSSILHELGVGVGVVHTFSLRLGWFEACYYLFKVENSDIVQIYSRFSIIGNRGATKSIQNYEIQIFSTISNLLSNSDFQGNI
eukprot:TRINITY_DN3565_c0_g1_i11.p5 TRINITY_DN3565_c0_g1~~TRINITY_DN3565_c0_g1_i11.p5  ORF type:complete len:100 (+),score=10.68 TRINITY_DN3565_c0_g1_i11:335-634(+)